MDMFRAEDILAQLQTGQDADSIAKEFTIALNKAVQENAAQNRFNEKVAFMDGIIEDLFDFIEEFYPDMEVAEARAEVDAVELVKSFDAAYKDVVQLKSILKMRDAARRPKPNVTISNDGIDAFLKANNLK